MTAQIIDHHPYGQKVRWIKAKASALLSNRGLLPRFKRWRLTQDPSTGMIVLFGILNNRYIAAHTSIPFSDYVDPSLLHDLANELQVQVVSCDCDSLRYAFILDQGLLDRLPTQIDYPLPDGEKRSVHVFYDDQRLPGLSNQQTKAILPIDDDAEADQTKLRRGVKAFLKVLDDIDLKDTAASNLPPQSPPDIVTRGEEEFKRQMAEPGIVWQESHPKQTV